MSTASLSTNPSPPESLSIDISANLLDSYFEEKRSLRRTRASGLIANTLSITAAMLVTLGVFTMWLGAQSSAEQSRIKLAKAESDLRAAGLGKDDKVADHVLQLPAQYQEKNLRLLSVIGSTLASTGADTRLHTLQATRGKEGDLKIVGQAETRDLLSVRALLDRVQVASPRTEGLITSVSQAHGASVTNLLVSFEIREQSQPRVAAMEKSR